MPGYSARPPATSTLLQEDAQVRIMRWDFEPGAATGHHVHGMDYVVVPLTDCHFLIEDAEGERRVFTPAGESYRRPAGIAHNVVNGGEAPMAFIEIEYKA
ncbi:cupin domain-containing protein [Rhizobium paknamense]|uniref:Quercetin dioxygenase-like cupin family protein n=1 Tax=Rhizobium paknamense TaxID=1206817 RepID=A0ABU0IBU7_9HYPH|nr:cupin domain-containing protein [Rhizobium paknamense]MDQ0455167.1 quercetin dioxygenase-like cupin family protein [Rhizobium paknamense]